MAVRVEPPRGRPGPREALGYPGLTAEERGLDPPSFYPAPPEPPPPLWVLPSDLPQSSRSVGFVGPLPEPIGPEPVEPEGLFDVPGLLERLWLARALEAHHERTTSPGVEPLQGHPQTAPAQSPSPASRSGGTSPAVPSEMPAGGAAVPGIGPSPTIQSETLNESLTALGMRPRSWVCPYCYLTNDAGHSTCRGCRSGALHL